MHKKEHFLQRPKVSILKGSIHQWAPVTETEPKAHTTALKPVACQGDPSFTSC